MERLTFFENGHWCIRLNGVVYWGFPEVDRLAAYEDTGLPPEEILMAKEQAEVACALNLLKEYQSIGSVDSFREFAQAEKDGRLVVRPCKVGDTLYSITCGEIKPFVVAGFEMYDKDLIAVEQIKLGRELRVVGKTAFLTREEAEAALKKKKEENI